MTVGAPIRAERARGGGSAYHMQMRSVPWLCLLLSGCMFAPSGSLPDELTDVPWQGRAGDAAVLEARLAADRGDPVRALEIVEEVLALQPRHVDAHRVRQDVLRERGRLGRVLAEADARVDAWDESAAAQYLQGRVQRDDDDKLRFFLEALESDRSSFWPWLGLGYVYRQRDPTRALSIYDQMYRATQGHPLVAVAYGAALRAAGPDRLALEVYSRLRDRPEMPGVGDLGIAETHLFADRRREAWAPLLASLRQRPWDPGVRRLLEVLVGHGLPRAQIEQVLGVLWEEPERTAALVRAGGAPLLAAMFERVGLLPAALEILHEIRDDATETVRRHARRLRLATGDVSGYLDDLAAALPPSLMAAERNQIRGLWLSVLEGPWRGREDPLADPDHAVKLARALVGAGLLVEAELLTGLGLAKHRGSRDVTASLRTIRDEVRREIAFEGALRRMLYQGYREEPRSLSAFLDDVREVAEEILGEDVVGEPVTYEVPFVGQLVDPFGPGLAEHLRRYNRHLVLGQRSGGPQEGLLLTRISVALLEPGGPLPLAGRSWEVIGEDREIESLQGVLGGDLAGVALLNHYVIDYDAVRDWAAAIDVRRRIVRADQHALLKDPVPANVDPLEPVDVAWRLGALSPVQDTELDLAVLDMIRWHERAHLVDSFRYLPPERNLWRVIGLVIEHAFSAGSIEAEMEGRAELAALAYSPFTRLVLAHIAGFLEAPRDQSAHAAGFSRLARRLNSRLAADAELAPFARASRWHEAPPEAIRRIAGDLAREIWP